MTSPQSNYSGKYLEGVHCCVLQDLARARGSGRGRYAGSVAFCEKMPIYQRRVFAVAKPLIGVKSDENIFTIPHTGEQFKDEA